MRCESECNMLDGSRLLRVVMNACMIVAQASVDTGHGTSHGSCLDCGSCGRMCVQALGSARESRAGVLLRRCCTCEAGLCDVVRRVVECA